MAWYEFHEQAREEIKIQRLANDLGVRYAEACGWMACLWAWVAGHRPDGNIKDLTSAELARYSCNDCPVTSVTTVTPDLFLLLLKKHHLIDQRGCINQWHKRGVKYLTSANYRTRKFREKQRELQRNSNVTETLSSNATVTVPTNRTLPTNHKDIKDGTDEALRAFMSHFTQSLKTKTGHAPDSKLVRKAYGKVVGYLKQWPDEQAAMSEEIDKAPSGMTQAWYVAFLCGQIEQRMNVHLKAESEKIGKHA